MFLDFGTYGLGAQAREHPALGLRTHRARRPAPTFVGFFFTLEPPLAYWLPALAMALFAQGVWNEFEELWLTERFLSMNTNQDGVKQREVKSVISREVLLPENGGTFVDEGIWMQI